MKLKLLSVILAFLFIAGLSSAQTPVASFQLSDTVICANMCITLTNNSTDATSYQWTFDGVTPDTSSLQNPGTLCYFNAGTYNITLTVYDNSNDSSSITQTITVTTGPTVQVSGGQLCDPNKLDWAQWAYVDNDSASGAISSDLSVLVTQSSGGLFTTAGMFNGGVFPPQYNVPINSNSIANQFAGIFTFCFNHPVIDPQIALASIGANGLSVEITTSTPYNVIWDGLSMTYPNDTTFIGEEGYTIVQFPGVQTCISFNYHQDETYCNIAFGIKDTNCQSTNVPPICNGNSVTLTATGNPTLNNSFHWTPSTGLSADTGAVVVASPSANTTYYVTCLAGNCSQTASDSVKIVVKQIPAPVAAISGMDSICGGTTDTLMATTGVGYSYSWNTGDTTSFVVADPNNTANYAVTITDTNACYAATQTTVSVEDGSNVFTYMEGDAGCLGDSITLSTSGNFKTFLWSTGATTPTIRVIVEVSAYTVTVADAYGCTASDGDVITIHSLPSTTVSGNNPFCDGDSIALDAGNGFNSYSWSTSATTEAITVSAAGNYTVTVTDGNGCSDTASATVTINSLPTVPVIHESGDTLYTSTDPGYLTYQWFNDTASIQNAVDTFLVITQSGNYYVQVTNASDCSVEGSFNGTIAGLENFKGSSFSLYPNPANDQLTIKVNAAGISTGYVIYDETGRTVITGKLTAEITTLDVRQLPEGLYLLSIGQGLKQAFEVIRN